MAPVVPRLEKIREFADRQAFEDWLAPDGRYSLGQESVWKHVGRNVLWISCNRNAVVKAAENSTSR